MSSPDSSSVILIAHIAFGEVASARAGLGRVPVDALAGLAIE